MQMLTNRDKVCQVLTYFISIGQNLHKLVNQRTLGVLAGTLINKLTLRVSNDTVCIKLCIPVACPFVF